MDSIIKFEKESFQKIKDFLHKKGYQANKIREEFSLQDITGFYHRLDIVVLGDNNEVFIIVEIKKYLETSLSIENFKDQMLNQKCKYGVLTDGEKKIFFSKDDSGSISQIPDLPAHNTNLKESSFESSQLISIKDNSDLLYRLAETLRSEIGVQESFNFILIIIAIKVYDEKYSSGPLVFSALRNKLAHGQNGQSELSDYLQSISKKVLFDLGPLPKISDKTLLELLTLLEGISFSKTDLLQIYSQLADIYSTKYSSHGFYDSLPDKTTDLIIELIKEEKTNKILFVGDGFGKTIKKILDRGHVGEITLATEATPYYSLLRLLFIIENKKLTLIKTNLSKEKKFDLIIVNPPYGIKNEKFGTKFGKTSSLEISTLYNSLEHLSTDGKLIGIFSEGLLFKSQSEFAQARKILKKETRIEAIIALPSGGVGAFTGIKTNLLLLKNTSPKTNKTVFVNLRVLWSLNWSELNQKIKKIIISKKATKSDIVFIISQDEINVENFSIESNNPLFSIELEKIQQKFETIKLGSRTDIIRGINSSLQTNIDSKIQLLQIRDLSNGRIQSDVIRYVSENSIKESSRLTTKNDILISVKGTIGKVALIGPTDVGKAISDSLVIIRPRNIDPLYLFYILQSDFLKMQLESATTGAVIKGISSAKLKEIIIPLPPAATKKEFSTKMNDLDIQLKKVEEERKKLTEEISKMKKEVYDLVFK